LADHVGVAVELLPPLFQDAVHGIADGAYIEVVQDLCAPELPVDKLELPLAILDCVLDLVRRADGGEGVDKLPDLALQPRLLVVQLLPVD